MHQKNLKIAIAIVVVLVAFFYFFGGSFFMSSLSGSATEATNAAYFL